MEKPVRRATNASPQEVLQHLQDEQRTRHLNKFYNTCQTSNERVTSRSSTTPARRATNASPQEVLQHLQDEQRTRHLKKFYNTCQTSNERVTSRSSTTPARRPDRRLSRRPDRQLSRQPDRRPLQATSSLVSECHHMVESRRVKQHGRGQPAPDE